MEDSKLRHVISDVRVAEIIDGSVRFAINSFLLDRRSRNLSKETLEFYTRELGFFSAFLDQQGVVMLDEISPDVIRRWLSHLSERRNGGGRHASYRSIRALLLWAWEEYEKNTRNPIKRVEPPKRNMQAKPGVPIDDVGRMVDACKGDKLAERDKAILLVFTDTGLRAGELIALNIQDVSLSDGSVLVKHGKGDKRRTNFIGIKTRRAVRTHLKSRPESYISEPLFLSDEGTRLTISGVRRMVEKRAGQAGVKVPSLHDFRRCFAITCLRNGMDLLTVSRLLGHTDVKVTERYLDLLDEDLRRAHGRNGPVDSAL